MEKRIAQLVKMEKHDFTDRFSQLPEDIVHHIMSFLPTITDTTRISILSKRLNSVWRSFPTLVFDQALYQKGSSSDGHEGNTVTFLNSVLYTLRLRRSTKNIDSLTFRARLDNQGFGYDGRDDDYGIVVEGVNWILNFAIQNNVKQLKLDGVQAYCRGGYGILRQVLCPLNCLAVDAMFSANTITNLDLRGLWFHPPHFTLSCPCIENFRLSDCLGLTSITLSATKLKTVKLLHCAFLDEIHIDAPSLEHLDLRGNGRNYFTLSNTSSKYLIKVAYVRCGYITENWLGLLSCVEKLKLHRCVLCWETLSLEHLRSLNLFEKVDIDRELQPSIECELQAPNLVEIKVDCMPRHCSMNISLNKMLRVELHYGIYQKLHYGNYSIRDSGFYENVLDFASKLFSRSCQALTLVCKSDEDLMIPQDVMDSHSPSLYGIENLKIELMYRKPKLVDYMVNSMLWLAPRPAIISIHCSYEPVKSIKFTYHEPMSSSVEGWEDRCLKQVKLENFESGSTEVDRSEDYFLERFGLCFD